MNYSVGFLVREAIDLAERGLFETAFVSACRAVSETVRKVFAIQNPAEIDYKEFLQKNIQLIHIMGVPETLPEVESVFNPRNPPNIRANYAVENFLFTLVYNTAHSGKIPFSFCFDSKLPSEMNIGKVLLPVNLIWGLLASVIFEPANAKESVPDRYWFRIGDFKIFISELWGRRDLAERFIKFYDGEKDD